MGAILGLDQKGAYESYRKGYMLGKARKEQRKMWQKLWLSELYPTFKFVALAIIANNVLVADDAVSSAVEKILKSVEKGNTAHNKTEFAGYCRTVVRGCAIETYTSHHGDVVQDAGAKNAARVMRPDRRHTTIPDLDSFDGEYDPYTRVETIESPETE
jgi:hypothetical protein